MQAFHVLHIYASPRHDAGPVSGTQETTVSPGRLGEISELKFRLGQRRGTHRRCSRTRLHRPERESDPGEKRMAETPVRDFG